ncbi:hypothetical protein UlMin_002719 [Ulmus minor]
MSFVTDSPISSSSSADDFATFLDSALDSNSSESAPEPEVEDEEEEEEEEEDYDVQNERVKRSKLEKLETVEEPSGSKSLEEKLEVSIKKDVCSHPGSFGALCYLCGQRVEEEESGVTFAYIHKGLRLHNDEIVRLRSTDMKKLLRDKKLYLVLDLDHTLLNSTRIIDMTPDEEYLKSQAASMQDSEGSLYLLETMHMMTKLRPFVRNFLKEAHKFFEMYIYTMGDRPYALAMAKLLDPKREYFGDRVISRDDGTQKHQKGLDIVLGHESAVLIIDDTENAWTKHNNNLVLIDRYHYFNSSCRQFGFTCGSLSQSKTDESDDEGALARILKVLKQVHNKFFDEPGVDPTDRDVRQVLKPLRKEVLKGCKIVFTRVFPTRFQADNHHLWKMAERLGATCSTELDALVTHVVSTDVGTEKSKWAVKENKFLVHPSWIETANYLWEKPPEENFPVKQANHQ